MALETEKADLSSLRIRREEPEPSSTKTISRTILIIALVAIAITVGYFLLQGSFASATDVELTTASLISPSQANAVLNASGYVVAQIKASVASKGTGRLVYLGVEEGDHVRKGQIIARLEDDDVVAAFARARADLQIARADFEDASRTLERVQTLYAEELVSKAELDAADARYRRIEASIQSAEAGLRAAEVTVENTRIRAPFDGTVLTKNADIGEILAPFASGGNSRGTVVTMADMSSLQVEADVSESNITRVSVAQPCEITLDAYPDVRYRGVVHKIVPTADRSKATVLTKVSFVERDERVLPEMSAKVAFLSKETGQTIATSQPKLTVPASAVVNREGRDIVLFVRQNRVEEIPVRTGERFANRIEILEGLTQGDQVILRPTPGLVTGSQVKTKE